MTFPDFTYWLAAALCACPGLPSLSAAEQAAQDDLVRASLEWEPGNIGGRRASPVELKSVMPTDLELPTDIGDPRHASIVLGDQKALDVVLDLTPGRERVWIDHDFDGDFRDNAYSQWERNGRGLTRKETVLVPFSTEENPVPVELILSLYTSAGVPSMTFVVDVYKTGQVVLGDRVRRLALRDETNRLRFNEGRSVVLFLDVNGDGQFETQHGSPEHLHLGDQFRLGDTGWSYEPVDSAATVIEFRRLAQPPPRVERGWQAAPAPARGFRPIPPAVTVEALKERYEAEKTRPDLDRFATIRSLGATGDTAAFQLLLTIAKKDASTRVRTTAVSAMGNAAFLEAHSKDMVKLLKDDDKSIAVAAVSALYQAGDSGLEARLTPLLTSRDDELVGVAAEYLAYLNSPASREQVVAVALNHGDARVRQRAYRGMQRTPEGPPVDLMLACAEGDDAYLKAMALGDLFSLDHPQASKLALEAAGKQATLVPLVNSISLILVAAGDAESVDALLSMSMNVPPASRAQIIDRLATLRSDDAISVLLDGLKSRNEELRGLCALVLASISTPEVADALAAQLKREKDTDTATRIIEALGEQEGENASKALLRAAKKKSPLRGVSIRSLARMGIQDPDVRKFLLSLLSSNTWQDTVYAIDAAAASGEVALGHKILPELNHKRWEVRLTTVQALRQLRSPDWVEPLIDQLEEETRPRVRNEIADTLFELTGVRIYTDPTVWRRWWKEHGDSFTMPDEIPEIPKSRPGDTVGGFYGLPVTSDRLVFVIDQSGSMSARDTTVQAETASERRTRLEQAVAQTVQAVSAMPDEAQVNVIFFESRYHRWQDGVQPLNRRNREELEEFLMKQRPMGGTNLYDGLELALSDPNVDTVILLSDGQPGAGKYVDADDILRAIGRLNQTRRTTIHCVSLGRDSRLLQELAEAHGGRYVRR